VDLDAVDFFEACFFTTLSLRFLELLLDRDDPVLFSALKKDVVLRIDFQEIHRLQRVDHPLVTLRILDDSFRLRTERKNIYSCFGQCDEILIVLKNQTLDFTLPELERLVSEEC